MSGDSVCSADELLFLKDAGSVYRQSQTVIFLVIFMCICHLRLMLCGGEREANCNIPSALHEGQGDCVNFALIVALVLGQHALGGEG